MTKRRLPGAGAFSDGFDDGFDDKIEGGRRPPAGGGTPFSDEEIKVLKLFAYHEQRLLPDRTGENAQNEGSVPTASGHSSHAEGISTTASGDYSHAEGSLCNATGRASHAEGTNNDATNTNAHAEGTNNIASGQNSHAEGASNEAEGYGSHAGGLYSNARLLAQRAQAGGRFANTGDAQHVTTVLRKAISSHASGTWYDLLINGNDALTIPEDSVWNVRVQVVGMTQGAAQRWSYELIGQVVNDGGTVSVTFTTTTIAESDANYDAQLAADTSNDALAVQVRRNGGTDYNVRWVATVTATEVMWPA